MTVFHDQAQFMDVMGQAPDETNTALYVDLIEEEWRKELKPALDKYLAYKSTENLSEVVDGAIDSIVVIAGLLNCLIGPDMATQAWQEVQRSNMSKAVWDDEAGAYKVIRREDGKVLKPSTFSPPNLFGLIAGVN
jgi:predicted HAD superfamily Cof-like phosphohydrolase